MFVEPDPRYGDAYEIEDDSSVPEGGAVLLEDGEGVLAAHDVAEALPDGPLCFLDGVRRTDFRVHDLLDDGLVVRGLAGTYGVGAVRCLPGERPEFLPPHISRHLFWTHGHAARLPAVAGWEWEPEPARDRQGLAATDPDALLAQLQRRMREHEAGYAGELASDGATVVRDGPLNRFYGINTEVVGLVKSHNRAYLPVDQHRGVPTIIARPGQRTSLFALRDEVWGCYLRLPLPGRASPWAGIVRIDVPAAAGAASASRVADRVCALMPRYAGVAHVDPRAPANLQPIGSLENHLRHLLGDPGGALRAARQAAELYDQQGNHAATATGGTP